MPHDTLGIKKEAVRLGFELVGVCEAVAAPHLSFYEGWLDNDHHATMEYLASQVPLKRSPQELLPEARSIVAVGLNYHQPNQPRDGYPRISSYALGRDYHRVIRAKLKRLSAWMEEELPGTACRPCVDSAPIFERDYARLAGLGWFGKNTCLIDSKRGSWFFLGLILTTADWEPALPAEGGCGNCQICIDACPTGAIVFQNNRWQVDSRRCISYLTIEHEGEIEPTLAAQIGEWTFGCDICQEVCPFNQPRETQPLRAPDTREPDFLSKRPFPSLVELANIEESRWDEVSQGSPIRRAGIEGIRRNARINLENARRSERRQENDPP